MRRLWVIVAGLGTLGAGLAASRALGSRAETTGAGPLAPCPGVPNCARVAVPLAAPVADVLAAVPGALAEIGARDVSETAGGFVAVAPTGPFKDDVAVAVESADGGSVLWVRSASRVGRSDLGVNARRVDHLVAAVRQRVGASGA